MGSRASFAVEEVARYVPLRGYGRIGDLSVGGIEVITTVAPLPADAAVAVRYGAGPTGGGRRPAFGCYLPDAQAVGRVGVSQDETMPASRPAFYNDVTVSGGPAPVRAYIEELLPDVLEGRIEPGRVFDRVVGLDEVADG